MLIGIGLVVGLLIIVGVIIYITRRLPAVTRTGSGTHGGGAGGDDSNSDPRKGKAA